MIKRNSDTSTLSYSILVDFHNPLILFTSPFAEQALVAVTNNSGGSDSEQKDKLETFTFFTKFLAFGFTKLQ